MMGVRNLVGGEMEYLSKVKPLIRSLGIRGCMKSVAYSLRWSGRPLSFLIGRRGYVTIESGAIVEIENLFSIGLDLAVPHGEKLGRSLLWISEDGTFLITGDTGLPRIGHSSEVHVQGRFSMGESYIGPGARVICHNDVQIGNGCAIAWDFEAVDTDFHELEINGESKPGSQPITIRDDVWIGSSVSIKKGTEIGEGAVIASNSVVTNDIPDHCLAAGIPAEVIREDVHWEP